MAIIPSTKREQGKSEDLTQRVNRDIERPGTNKDCSLPTAPDTDKTLLKFITQIFFQLTH